MIVIPLIVDLWLGIDVAFFFFFLKVELIQENIETGVFFMMPTQVCDKGIMGGVYFKQLLYRRQSENTSLRSQTTVVPFLLLLRLVLWFHKSAGNLPVMLADVSSVFKVTQHCYAFFFHCQIKWRNTVQKDNNQCFLFKKSRTGKTLNFTDWRRS